VALLKPKIDDGAMGLLLLYLNLCWADSVASRWAPVIHQEIGSEPHADEFTRVDFDGDWNAKNNWEHLTKFPRPASVYYAVIESEQFYFITYALFFPRDYASLCFWMHCHENDFEGLRVTVKKPDTLWRLETLAHNRLSVLERPKIVEVMVEREGHGVYAKPPSAPFKTYQPQDYELISLDGLWQRRKSDLFRGEFVYQGRTLPANFSGDDWIVWGIGAAKPPWAWEMWGTDWDKGEWFMHPLKGVKENYLHHPYIVD
jgi:hypothetical protein